jgi:hypothetical protein
MLEAIRHCSAATPVCEAASTLRAGCRAGRLRFDVDRAPFSRDGSVTQRLHDCGRP